MSDEVKDEQAAEVLDEVKDAPEVQAAVEVKDEQGITESEAVILRREEAEAERQGLKEEAEEKMAGVKEVASNEPALVTKPKESESAEVKMPSFFVQPDERVTVEVDILFDKSTGRILSVSKKGLLTDEALEDYVYLGHTAEAFTFTQPTYDDLTTYRQKSAIFRREVNRVVVDTLQMRNFLIVWHMKDWTIRDSSNKKIELSFDTNGSLSDESIKVVYELSPAILDVVLSIYEKDIILS